MKEKQYRAELFEVHNMVILSDSWLSSTLFNSYLSNIADKFKSYKDNRQRVLKLGRVSNLSNIS